MNLRILKKLSKRAAPLLTALGDGQKQFPAKPFDCYHGGVIRARKHWERRGCHDRYEGRPGEIVFTTRTGRRMVMSPPSHPLAGTIMVGGMSGYYEPEWDEESAWHALSQQVYWHFMEIDEEGNDMKPTRSLRTPAEILRAAREMVAARRVHG